MRPEHRASIWRSLKEKGQLAASGPFADGSGALIVYEADSPAAAESILKARPVSRQRHLSPLAPRPWNTVIANRQLFPE